MHDTQTETRFASAFAARSTAVLASIAFWINCCEHHRQPYLSHYRISHHKQAAMQGLPNRGKGNGCPHQRVTGRRNLLWHGSCTFRGVLRASASKVDRRTGLHRAFGPERLHWRLHRIFQQSRLFLVLMRRKVIVTTNLHPAKF